MSFITRFGFNNSPFLNRCDTNPKVKSLMVSNGIYDEIKIDEILDSLNSILKEEWSMDTAFLAKFQKNLEAGNIGQGTKIEKLRFKRRKVGTLDWETMLDMNFNIDIENYDMIDYLIESSDTYEYALVPLLQGFEGQGVSSQVDTNYISMFLTGSDGNGNIINYPLRFDETNSDIKINEDIVYQKTLSSQYPARLCGESKYLTGNINVKLISPTTEKNNGKVDFKAEKVYRKAFEDFIHGGRPMLIRNHSLYILATVSEPTKNPAFNNEVAFGLYDYQFIFTEYADAQSMENLKNSGLSYTVATS